MGLFKVDLKGSFEHDIKKIDRKFIPIVLDSIENLSENPFPVQSRKMKDAESTYRLRVGDYRVIYQVNVQNKVVVVYYIRHRKDAYRH